MARDQFSELRAFIAVVQERGFAKAAARLGVSASALSHTIRGLEERLGLRLLLRTTRSVSTTEAGERLFHAIAPHFEQIHAELDALSELGGQTVRFAADQFGDTCGANDPATQIGGIPAALSGHQCGGVHQ